MGAKFEVYQGSGGKFFWHLRRANGQTIVSGGPYATKNDADKAIESVKAKAPDAAVVHLEKPPKPLTPAEQAHLTAVERQARLKILAARNKVKIIKS
jgi:uncharacterized protein YegP (UPF0339 family)